MKKRTLGIAAALMTMLIAATAGANVYVTPLVVTSDAFNNTPFPVRCTGTLHGYTTYGNDIFVAVDMMVYPGQYAYAYVYTSEFNPFVRGRFFGGCG